MLKHKTANKNRILSYIPPGVINMVFYETKE